jgi:hypothetical protein
MIRLSETHLGKRGALHEGDDFNTEETNQTRPVVAHRRR